MFESQELRRVCSHFLRPLEGPGFGLKRCASNAARWRGQISFADRRIENDPRPLYTSRKALTGSIRDARIAGMRLAIAAVASSTITTADNVAGSRIVTPNNCDRMAPPNTSAV